MKKFLFLLLVLSTFVPSALALPPPAPWETVAAKAGADSWNTVETLTFTWSHASGKSRHYVWDVPSNSVVVTRDGQSVTVPTSGGSLHGEAEIAAHKAFINDSYWFLFDLRALWDSATKTQLGTVSSPFGKHTAYRIAYGATGGYSPGDHYVVYVGVDGAAMGWSFFPGGSAEPKLSTTRERYKKAGPLTLPTLFRTPDGAKVIEITDLAVTTR